MAAGKGVRAGPRLVSPVVRAIADTERMGTSEIRVHLSRRWRERDAFGRARGLFAAYGMQRTQRRNAVLIYLNLRTRDFAVVADEGALRALEPRYWDELGSMLRDDLLATHPENAIALAVRTVGASLARYFPHDIDAAPVSPTS
jgi:uncharacterized membrane protein